MLFELVNMSYTLTMDWDPCVYVVEIINSDEKDHSFVHTEHQVAVQLLIFNQLLRSVYSVVWADILVLVNLREDQAVELRRPSVASCYACYFLLDHFAFIVFVTSGFFQLLKDRSF